MKQLSILLLLSILIASCAQPDERSEKKSDSEKKVEQYSIEQFLTNSSIYAASFSHDEERLLVGSNVTGIYNANIIDLKTGEISPLTESEEGSIWVESLFPEDDRMIYSADNDGDEIDHLYLREVDGTVKELTPGAEAKAGFYGWADDQESFYYGFNRRDPRYMDVYKMGINDFEPTLFYQNNDGLDVNRISNTERYLALSKTVNTNDSDLILFDRETDKQTKINETVSSNNASSFSVNDDALFYTTDEGSEFKYLMRYDIATGKKEKVLQEDWDIAYAYLSEEGKYRVVGINKDGKNEVKLFDTASGEQLDFPTLPDGDVSGVRISKSEEKMVISAGSSRSTTNLYLYDLGSKELTQLTNTLNPDIDPEDLVDAEVVRYASFDGVEIPAIYYKPKNASADNKVPALVMVHGGPGGQSRVGYNSLTQYLVNHGYAVLAVNNRGSSGYGKTFFRMDDQDHGEADLQDCIEGKRYLASLPYIDKDKIGIIGGSYGGFMVMRAMTHAPEEFEVGVNLFGVTNWLRTLKSIPPWWESFRDALYLEMGDPNTADSVRLYGISPVFHGDKVKNPVMVLQGATDPRVLQVESDEMVAAIRENDVPVEYVLFDDEGHGFVKKENQIEGYGQVLEFLDTYLKEGNTVKSEEKID